MLPNERAMKAMEANDKIMDKLNYYLLMILCVFILGCTVDTSAIQANGELKFGRYIFTPPDGYWFFVKKYPANFKTKSDFFVVTFWESKEAVSREGLKGKETFFNFAVSSSVCQDYKSYYDEAGRLGVTYEHLPVEASALQSIDNWSCKQTDHGIFGIECVSLRKELVTFGIYGNEKGEVMAKIPVFKKMIESFKVQ